MGSYKIQKINNNSIAKQVSEGEIEATKKVLEKISNVSELMAKEFGFDKEAVMKDFIRDLLLVQNPQFIERLDMSSPVDVMTKELFEKFQEDEEVFNDLQENALSDFMNTSNETIIRRYKTILPMLPKEELKKLQGNNNNIRRIEHNDSKGRYKIEKINDSRYDYEKDYQEEDFLPITEEDLKSENEEEEKKRIEAEIKEDWLFNIRFLNIEEKEIEKNINKLNENSSLKDIDGIFQDINIYVNEYKSMYSISPKAKLNQFYNMLNEKLPHFNLNVKIMQTDNITKDAKYNYEKDYQKEDFLPITEEDLKSENEEEDFLPTTEEEEKIKTKVEETDEDKLVKLVGEIKNEISLIDEYSTLEEIGKIENLIELYSDWHKDIYGIRPRISISNFHKSLSQKNQNLYEEFINLPLDEYYKLISD